MTGKDADKGKKAENLVGMLSMRQNEVTWDDRQAQALSKEAPLTSQL